MYHNRGRNINYSTTSVAAVRCAAPQSRNAVCYRYIMFHPDAPLFMFHAQIWRASNADP